MRQRILFATGNEGKMKEIRAELSGLEAEIQSLKDAGIQAEIEENGETFEENAVIKAEAVRELTGELTLADDSGLEIDALNGEPGVYSARYAGEDTPYSVKNRMLLERLKDVPEEKRTARFVCAIAAALPDGRTVTERGVIEGRIGYEEKGGGGFGYDPIFYVPECGRTMAEMTMEQKNRLSHRGKALRLMKERLQRIIADNGR